MNYQHEFHAGNFADVFKHVVFCRILHYLREKPAAFRVIDTHAGAGLYDLTNEKAMRGGEWHSGIGKLMDAPIPQSVATLLSPYLDVVRAVNERDRLRVYPGSPALARAWLRPQDRLIACELEPKAAAALSRNLHGDNRIKTLLVDGWTALKAYVPPKERRGLVLVDPPFEAEDDFSRLASGLAAAHRKWATGVYALWYPIKGRREVDALAKRLRRLACCIASWGPDPPKRCRDRRSQSPLDARKRTFRPFAGSSRTSRARRQGHFSARLAWR